METIKKWKQAREAEKKEDSPNLIVAVEELLVLNGTLVEEVRTLSSDLDNLKDRVAQVAARLGL
tara:strand:- start:346 stop:537 length:192 start_codon:yes stop_codon:yes gene_type:complete